MTHKFRIKLSNFKVHGLTVADSKSSKSLYLKIKLDTIEKYYTYVEKNAMDEVEWYSSFNTNVEFDSLNELKSKEVTIILYEKNRGFFGKDVCLGGFKVDFLTLATGPASVNMPIQSSSASISGRMSMVSEFEHFSDATVQITDIVILAADNLATKYPAFFGNNALSVALVAEQLSEVIWPVNTTAVSTSKERSNVWKSAPPIHSALSIRTVFSGLSLKLYKKTSGTTMTNECTFPVLKYCNLESRPMEFEEPLVDGEGTQIGIVKGKIQLLRMPFLSQMPRGALTEAGVRDPQVIFPEVPLPRCAIYRSVVESGEPPLPWVKIDVFEGASFYYNNITFEKKVFELESKGVVSTIMDKAASSIRGFFASNTISTNGVVPPSTTSASGDVTKSGTPTQPTSRGKELASERAKLVKGWVCSSCTFVNSGGDSMCQICASSMSSSSHNQVAPSAS